MAYRTQLFNPEDIPNVEKIQAGYKVQPLSAYLRQPAPPAAPAIAFPKIDKELINVRFWEYLAFSLHFAPPGPEEKEIRAKIQKLGVAMKEASPEMKAAVEQGIKQGEEKIKNFLETMLKDVNGWRIGSAFGDRNFYHGNWLLRAAATAGIYGNDAVEAVYPIAKTLPNGELLDGSKHNYTLTFQARQLRPSTRSGQSRCTTARRSCSSRTRSTAT